MFALPAPWNLKTIPLGWNAKPIPLGFTPPVGVKRRSRYRGPVEDPAFEAERKTYVGGECSILIMLNGADAYSTGEFIVLITRFS